MEKMRSATFARNRAKCMTVQELQAKDADIPARRAAAIDPNQGLGEE